MVETVDSVFVDSLIPQYEAEGFTTEQAEIKSLHDLYGYDD